MDGERICEERMTRLLSDEQKCLFDMTHVINVSH